jgi:hypothetical protein
VSAVRYAVGGAGVLLGLWGLWLISGSADADEMVSIGIWLAGGVVAHDVLIAAVTLIVAALATRVLPSVARAPATVGLVVLGTFTVVAIPFLGRFGASATNETLLDRNYVAGYLLVVALVVAAVVVSSLLRPRTHTGSAHRS